MTTWLALIEIEAEAVLPEGAPPVQYTDPRGRFRLRLLNRRVCPRSEKPLIDMHLEYEAASLRAADELVKPYAREFLRWLSLVTQMNYRIREIKRVVDWTPGLAQREQFIYHADRSDMPHPAVIQEFVDTIATLNALEPHPAVQRAVRWYAVGVGAELPDDQFQCFFFAIELLAEHHKPPESVADRCPVCKADLYCQTCDTVPTHTPYAKHAIEQLVRTIVTDDTAPGETYRWLNFARTRLMHGSQITDFESKLPYPFEDLVDRAERVAWHAILKSIPLPAGEHRLNFASASTIVNRTLVLKAHVIMGMLGNPATPRVEDLPTLEISVKQVERQERPDPAGPNTSGTSHV